MTAKPANGGLAAKPSDGAGDPYLWLEEIESQRVASWVDAENAATEGALHDDRYRADFAAALAILNSDEKLAFIGKKAGGFVVTQRMLSMFRSKDRGPARK